MKVESQNDQKVRCTKQFNNVALCAILTGLQYGRLDGTKAQELLQVSQCVVGHS